MASTSTAQGPRASLVLLLATGAGLSVAGLYYNQPILRAIADDLRATDREVGLVPMLTQLGYALGLVLLAPLGDRLDRRRVIVTKASLLAVALLGAALATSVGGLWAASLAIGLLATVAQDYVPAAATLAAPEARGQTVGRVMMGLLLGILLSRVVSGAVAAHLGWRTVFLGAAGLIALLALGSQAKLPRFAPTASESYPALLASLARLVRDLPELRRAALAQGLLSVAFSGFWSTLALALAAPPHHLGSTAAGAFGLAGAVGVLAAPLAGALADRRGPRALLRAGSGLVVASFVMMSVWTTSLPALVLGAIAFDLGVQATLISHQTIVYSLEPSARSRLNAVFMSTVFLGMSTGAALASYAFSRAGWLGVTLLGATAASLALALQLLPTRARDTTATPALAAG